MEKTLKNTSAFFIANIWPQLGWRPPCEVSKDLIVPVAFSIGLGVIWPSPYGMESSSLIIDLFKPVTCL
jgi:hypothetical protein